MAKFIQISCDYIFASLDRPGNKSPLSRKILQTKSMTSLKYIGVFLPSLAEEKQQKV